MKKRRILLMCSLVALALLLSVGAAFAEEDGPDPDNPVIQFLATITGQSPEDILAQREAGFSLGKIARGYLFAQMTGLDASEVQGESHGHGWGVLFRNAEDLHPGGGGRGLGWLIGKGHTNTEHGGGPPDHAGGPPEWAGGPGGNPDE